MDTNPTNINTNDVPSSTQTTNNTNTISPVETSANKDIAANSYANTPHDFNEPIHNSIEKIDLVASPEFVNIGSTETPSETQSAEAAEAVAAKELQDLPLPQPTAYSSGDSAVERKSYKTIILACVAGLMLMLLVAVIAVVKSGTN